MSTEKLKGPINLPNTMHECEQLMERLAAESTNLKLQLDHARAKVATTGEYAPSGWFNRASAALRYMNRDRQRLQEHMAKLRRADKENVAQAYDAVLIATLREIVGESIFHRAEKIANSRLLER